MKASEATRSSQRCWLCGNLGWLCNGKHICEDCDVEWGPGSRRCVTDRMTDEQMINHERKNFYEPGLEQRVPSPG
jgi:hypothetical protein